jgi:poly(hydroxyalkanoate) granule-associated protein
MEHPGERGTSLAQISAPVVGTVRGVWLAGLGLIATLGEQTRRQLTALVDKGKQVEPSISGGLRKAGQQVGSAAQAVGTRVKSVALYPAQVAEASLEYRIHSALDRIGVPTKEEINSLSEKLDKLAARFEQLQKNAKKPVRKKSHED